METKEQQRLDGNIGGGSATTDFDGGKHSIATNLEFQVDERKTELNKKE